MEKQNIIYWIIAGVFALFLVGNLGLFAIFPESQLVIDTNQDCAISPGNPICVYEGHISNTPSNINNASFYISTSATPYSEETSSSLRILEVWNGTSWETLFDKQFTVSGHVGYDDAIYYTATPGKIVKITSKSYSPPSTRICGCDSTHNLDFCKTSESIASYESAVCADPCFTATTKYGAKRTYCTMPQVFLDNKYIINNTFKFRITQEHLSGINSLYPRNNPFSLREVDFGIKEVIPETINIYRLENNQCSLVNVLLSEITSDDYNTLSECETNINVTETNQSNLSELINPLNLTINEQIELISQLELSIAEEEELVSQLDLTIQEQQGIISGLENKQGFDFSMVLFDIGDFEVELWMILLGGGVFILLIVSGGKKR